MARTALALTFVAVSSAACSSSATADSLPLPEVTVTSPGAAPRHTLRLKATNHDSEAITMAMDMSMEMDAGPALHIPRTTLPTMKLDFDVKVTDVSKDGKTGYDATISKIEIVPGNSNPTVVESVRKSTEKLQSLKGHAVVDSRNFTLASKFDIPPGVDQNVRQMLDSMSQSFGQFAAPFPAEAVGIGAKWRTKVVIPANGMRLTQIADYTITAINGDVVEADVTLVQSAANQMITSPSLPSSMKMKLVKMTGKGSGHVRMEQGKVVPRGGSMSLTTNAEMSIDAGTGAPQAMTMGLDLAVKIDGT